MATSSKPRETDKLARDVSQENTPDSPVVQALRQQTANAFVLYANYKHYHWQTFGPLFRDLHLLFDEFAVQVLATVDEFAETILRKLIVEILGTNVSDLQRPARPLQRADARAGYNCFIGEEMQERRIGQ